MASALVTRKVLKDEVVLVTGLDEDAPTEEQRQQARRMARRTHKGQTQFSQDLEVTEITDVEMG